LSVIILGAIYQFQFRSLLPFMPIVIVCFLLSISKTTIPKIIISRISYRMLVAVLLIILVTSNTILAAYNREDSFTSEKKIVQNRQVLASNIDESDVILYLSSGAANLSSNLHIFFPIKIIAVNWDYFIPPNQADPNDEFGEMITILGKHSLIPDWAVIPNDLKSTKLIDDISKYFELEMYASTEELILLKIRSLPFSI